jgi:type II secretory pathway component GspD/PulD (secretin)
MKTKITLALIAGSLLAATAQTNTPVAGSPAPVVIATTNVDPPSATPAPVAEAAPAAPAGTAPDLSVISFSDASLTTAIENLARRANINYLLDPKIGYNLPDANGQVKLEPIIPSIRWENIPAERALLALLDNYGLQLVQNRDTGIDKITMKDPAAPPPLETQVIQLKYMSVSNILDAAQSTFTDKRSKVIADARTSQIVVVATHPELDAVTNLVAKLDTPTRQVLIETRLVEVSSSPQSKKGIDWAGTLGGQHVSFGNNLLSSQNSFAPGAPISGILGTNGLSLNQQQLSSLGVVANTASGLGTMGFLNADGLSAVLSFLNASSDAQVVSTPRIVTLDNQTAEISVTRGFPVFNVSAGTANTSGGSSITYSNVGTVLQVTPRISAGDKIWLKVHPEVSSFFGTVSKTVGGQVFQADLFDNRHFDTQVLIPNEHTLVLGGLVKDSPNSTRNKVPLLGDVPLLGYAFRSESKSMDKQNLLIFITPTIVQDTDFHESHTKFLQAQPVKTRQFLDPDSAWDGTRPASHAKTKTDPQALINEDVTQ